MLKSVAIFSLLAAFTLANAQSEAPSDSQPIAPSQPAPIVRVDPARANPSLHSAFRQPGVAEPRIVESQPVPGIWLRSESSSALETISATPQDTEIRLERGRLNVTVHHPADHAAILIDLPGGQTSLFKDGVYTFNADTNTVRVLRGEAAAYPGPLKANASAKPIKIKEDHELSLVATPDGKAGELKAVEAYPYELSADLLPIGDAGDRGYGQYGDYAGYSPYPYYAGGWGYPYGYGFYPGYYGYPFAYGIGFGYYGGFGGGFRGGFRR